MQFSFIVQHLSVVNWDLMGSIYQQNFVGKANSLSSLWIPQLTGLIVEKLSIHCKL